MRWDARSGIAGDESTLVTAQPGPGDGGALVPGAATDFDHAAGRSGEVSCEMLVDHVVADLAARRPVAVPRELKAAQLALRSSTMLSPSSGW